MNSERREADFESERPASSEPAASHSRCYLAASPMGDVLYDQLEYLLAHTGEHCAPECMDCGRLQQVKNWLLMPFYSAIHPPVH